MVVGEWAGGDEVEVHVSAVNGRRGAARCHAMRPAAAVFRWLTLGAVRDVADAPSSDDVPVSPLSWSVDGASPVGCADGSAVLRLVSSANAINELPCPSASANRTTNDTNEASPRLVPRLRRLLDLVPIPYLPNWCGALHLTDRCGPRPTVKSVVRLPERYLPRLGDSIGRMVRLFLADEVVHWVTPIVEEVSGLCNTEICRKRARIDRIGQEHVLGGRPQACPQPPLWVPRGRNGGGGVPFGPRPMSPDPLVATRPPAQTGACGSTRPRSRRSRPGSS